MRAARNLVLLAVTLALAGPACVGPREAAPAPEVDGLPWHPFQWIRFDMQGRVFEKAAIYVPFTSDTLGGTYWLQLDTGSDVALRIYRAPLKQLLARRGAAYDSTRALRMSGRVGAYEVRSERLTDPRFVGDTITSDDPHPKIGTLGLSFFRSRVLLLDMPRARFAILDSAAALPAWIAARVRWVPAEYRNEKLFVPLTLNGRTYDGFFYDSGASLFALNTTPEIWRQATGRTGSEPDNERWTVPSFGQQIVMQGAPVQGRVAVGAAALERPLAFHLAEGPERLDFRTWSFPVSGLFGNALFYDRHLVIVDLPRRRFGLVESPST